MLIGILQTGHLPDPLRDTIGDYDVLFHRLLAGHGFDFVTYDVVDGVFPDSAESADGWLITGSRHGAYDDLDWIAPLEALIRAIAASGRPLVGICFGHQIIAQALGGRVEKFSGGWAVGRTDYDTPAGVRSLNAWHQDQIVALPPGAEVRATGPDCAYAALTYGDRIWTVQAHPEFDAEAVRLLIETRGKGVVPEPLLDAARARLDRPTDREAVADEMAAVLLKGRAERAA